MKRTCSFAPIRVESHAASALPGSVANPITAPVAAASASSRSKRWNSAALHRSRTMVESASVASTAGPVSPALSSSETWITPVPVAMPEEKPNTAAPAASPGARSTAARLRSSRRSGTDPITARPRMLPITRASSTL